MKLSGRWGRGCLTSTLRITIPWTTKSLGLGRDRVLWSRVSFRGLIGTTFRFCLMGLGWWWRGIRKLEFLRFRCWVWFWTQKVWNLLKGLCSSGIVIITLWWMRWGWCWISCGHLMSPIWLVWLRGSRGIVFILIFWWWVLVCGTCCTSRMLRIMVCLWGIWGVRWLHCCRCPPNLAMMSLWRLGRHTCFGLGCQVWWTPCWIQRRRGRRWVI